MFRVTKKETTIKRVWQFILSLCICLTALLASANTPPAPEGLTLTPFVDGLELPVFITPVTGSNDTLFVLEKGGRVRLVENGVVSGTSVLDIENLVSTGLDQGLLGIAVHPEYQSNGFIFVNYTDEAGDTQIVRYTVSANVADPASAKTILSVDQPHNNHNGGMVTFGPDGYLYIVMGDGGSQGDPDGNGQNMNSLLSKMLRIDVDNGDPYSIPEDNPFVGQEGVRPEIWTSGWRMPWRFSFDRETGDMWLADVGQNEYEEISFQAAGQGGGNYGWRCYEATHEYDLSENCEGKDFIDPVLEYDHSQGASVTGGYVYRGSAIPELQGRYVYGDFTNGYIWLASQQDDNWTTALWQDTDLNISSFGEDADGELFVIDYSGTIYRLTQE
jgi:glucose/arabinose dehydrogenase